ncbi:unnamed protein product [Orchesella dallaii]|uniref:Uncharacterized protein n=1 Tax=Orchesella dallaii TaxID=48710 RepID=A0ABP1PZJ0_9HEXA
MKIQDHSIFSSKKASNCLDTCLNTPENMAFFTILIWTTYSVFNDIVISESTLNFPVKLDPSCFINIVTENSNNFTISAETFWDPETLINNHQTLEKLLSWTINDVNFLQFGFEKEELEDDGQQITINDRYFKLVSKHRTECTVFILFPQSFNGTLHAIHRSGYGTSNRVTYLIAVSTFHSDEDEILTEFSQDLFQENVEPDLYAFHAPIAFFEKINQDVIQTYLNVYCYLCPENLGKFHPLLKLETISKVKSHSISLNNQGYGSEVVLHAPGNWESKDMKRKECRWRDRKLFDRINRCHYAEMVVYNRLEDVFNVTYKHFRPLTVWDDSSARWYLNIYSDEWSTGNAVMENVYAMSRGSYQLFQQVGYKFIYCNDRAHVSSLAWDVFIHVFNLSTWLCLICTIVLYIVLTRRIFRSLDLLWLFLGMPTWYEHPKILISLYLIPIMFLQSNYNSATSTDFIQLMSPLTPPVLFAKGYKVWVPGMEDSSAYMRLIYNRAPEFMRKRVEELIGGLEFEQILYKLKDKNDSLPSNSKTVKMVKAMASRKLLLTVAGLPRYHTLMQIFGAVDWALIEDKYLCGAVDLPDHINIPKRRHAYRTLGYLSESAAAIIGRWYEMGFIQGVQNMLNYKLSIVNTIRWIEVAKVSEQLAIGYNSPLGIACMGLVIVHLTLLGVLIFQIISLHLKWKHIQTFIKRLKGNRVESIHHTSWIE